MSHVHYIEDPNTGDLTTLRVFCSDYCHRLWCEHNREEYGGWNGCHETSYTEPCGWCLTPVPGLDEDGGAA
jgi:hypothetical protein